jgi:peptidoglycan/LPS O-acetylase OafA/YrhL
LALENAAKAEGALPERIHALDALRATMLFLVVLFHCAMSYTVGRSNVWTFKDETTTGAADFIVRFVHVFTLPTFFILAGFFSAMLYWKRGPVEFTHNRGLRIALPFAVGWTVLHPIVGSGFIFANAAKGASLAEGWAAVQAAVMNGSVFFPDDTMHLWFMYNLIIYYAFALALIPLVMFLPATWRNRSLQVFAFIIARPWLRLIVLGIVSMGMLRMVGGTLYVSLSFIPNLLLLLAYSLYFSFGWLLYLVRDQVRVFTSFAWTQTLLGVAIFVLVGPALRLLVGGPLPRGLVFVVLSIQGAVLVWLFFFGLTGLYLRHFNRGSPGIRYVVDASFWIYLVHLPLTIWLPGLISGLAVPASIKILMVLGITYVFGFATYDLFVRSTVIGFVLCGRRYPRSLFGSASMPAPTQTAR